MGKTNSLMADIQASLEKKEFQQTKKLLKQWQKVEPRNPWLHLYAARWYEATDKVEMAEKGYRQLLRGCDLPKVVQQARQGLQRLEQRVVDAEAAAIASALASTDGDAYGLFVIEPILKADQKAAAQHFATVMKTDAYSARLQLPTRAWRLFRTGKLGELKFYADALKQGQIPGFCLSFAALEAVQVFQVRYVQNIQSGLVVRCADAQQQEVTLKLAWQEIEQCVAGTIPLFEESLEKDGRGKTFYKTKVLDYAQFWDLHVGDRQLILRFNDQHYQFKEGIPLIVAANQASIEQHSVRRKWNQLKQELSTHLAHAPTWSEFKSFAGNAADFPELLRKTSAQVHLFRLEKHKETHWDPAWQLYSTMIFVKKAQDLAKQKASKN
ncbi:MAG: hypothetical protein WBB82_16500 [Limnothrix sp.]